MSYQPILEDPIQIASLSGQRFVVLRAPVDVAAPWNSLQHSLRGELSGNVFYPAAAHLTLAGCVAGTATEAVAALVRDWAASTPVLRLEAEAIDSFPPPAQIASVRVRKTPALAAAVRDLRERAATAGVIFSSAAALDEWVPRMSLVYGGRLDAPGWQQVIDTVLSRPWSPAGGDVADAEVLVFDEGREVTGGTFPFGA